MHVLTWLNITLVEIGPKARMPHSLVIKVVHIERMYLWIGEQRIGGTVEYNEGPIKKQFRILLLQRLQGWLICTTTPWTIMEAQKQKKELRQCANHFEAPPCPREYPTFST